MIERNVKVLAVQISLKKMISNGWFSICDVETAMKLMEVGMSTEDHNFLHTLHCVKFDDMPAIVKNKMQSILEVVFSKEAFEIVVGKTLLGKPKVELLQFNQRGR